MKSLFNRKTLLAGVLAVGASSSYAASATGSFDVTLQVQATCSITASNLSFSSITTGTTSNTDATSSLTVNCSTGTPYSVALGNGANFQSVRRMAWGGSTVDYILYQDSSRSIEWNSSSTKASTGNGSDQNFTIYGRIPSGQNIRNTGSYGDTVIATVTY